MTHGRTEKELERDHVVLVGRVSKCLNCGAMMEVVLPVRVTDWCNALNSFTTQHRDCLPPSAPQRV